ncbi:MAG TPA: NUDIX hydrolase [Actinobacteria bacterium]|nr:NUDIX hydrolase [Actinomycetota bacterium]
MIWQSGGVGRIAAVADLGRYHVRMQCTPRDANSQTLRRFSADLLAILRAYHTRFPEEAIRHETLLAQLAAGEDVSIRSNMRGHVTTSATILNARRDKVLLIHHRIFRNWLPPGGHYESPGSLWDSAVRETSEETGVRIIAPHPWTVEFGLPVDVDTHPIPARPEKDEGPHVHHDFRFLAVASDDDVLVADLSEVTAARWTPVDELHTSPDERVRALHGKLARLGIFAG